MQIKDGVIIAGLQIEMRKALVAADKIWKDLGEELVITAGLEGAHSAGSLHYYGYALDLRSRYFDEASKMYAVDTLQTELGDDYDVVSHSSHIHVEYDPR